MNFRQHSIKTKRHRHKIQFSLVTFLLISNVVQTGCAGSQLTTEEQTRYDQLLVERDQIANERSQLTQQVNADFSQSGNLEKRHKAVAKDQTLSCGYLMSRSSFGPLPFRKKKDKKATFGKAKSAPRSGCKHHSLRVK